MLQKNNNISYFLVLLLVGNFFFFSCKEAEPIPSSPIPTDNNGVSHTIAVTVTHYYTNSDDSLLMNAKVDVYPTSTDRNNATNKTYSSLTNKLGECNFNNVNVGDYFLVISKDSLKTALEEIKITENTAKGIVNAILY